LHGAKPLTKANSVTSKRTAWLARIILAYVFIILLWATTPLAIKWSSQGAGFLFAGATRMSIGAVCLLIIIAFRRKRLELTRLSLLTYAVIAVQVYGSMVPVYWAAKFIPSGWISVVLGLSPLITATMSAIWLSERSLGWANVFSYLLGVAGLAVMFGSALQLGQAAVFSIAAVVFSAFLQCASAVWVKRIDAKLSAFSQVTGGVLLSLPFYWANWYFVDGVWPNLLDETTIACIVYLGVIATTIGFILYYFLLSQLGATQVALITLISPVLALMLGHVINQEPLNWKIAAGTACILLALVIHTYVGMSRLRRA